MKRRLSRVDRVDRVEGVQAKQLISHNLQPHAQALRR
jgi:hypothetical protein